MPALRSTLDPKLDIVFWMLFAPESNRALLLSLLTAVLQPPTPIEAIELLDPDLDLSAIDEKGVVLDLRVRLATGEQIDIEMQSRPHRALNERILYYWSKLYSGQLERGVHYTKLRRAVGVLFADFSTHESTRFHSVFRACEQHSHALFTDHLELHVVELPRLRTASAESDEPLLVLWCKFLSATTDAEREGLAQEHAIMTQAKTALDDLSADPAARRRAEYREMSEKAYWTGMNAARRDGHEEGRVEGKAEALLTLLALRFGGLPEEAELRVRAATQAELDSWFERVLSANSIADVLAE